MSSGGLYSSFVPPDSSLCSSSSAHSPLSSAVSVIPIPTELSHPASSSSRFFSFSIDDFDNENQTFQLTSTNENEPKLAANNHSLTAAPLSPANGGKLRASHTIINPTTPPRPSFSSSSISLDHYRAYLSHSCVTNEELRQCTLAVNSLEAGWTKVEEIMKSSNSLITPSPWAPDSMDRIFIRPRVFSHRRLRTPGALSGQKGKKEENKEQKEISANQQANRVKSGVSREVQLAYPPRSSRVGDLYQCEIPLLLTNEERNSDKEKFLYPEYHVPEHKPIDWENTEERGKIAAIAGIHARSNESSWDLTRFLKPRAAADRILSQYPPSTVTVRTSANRIFTVHTHIHQESQSPAVQPLEACSSTHSLFHPLSCSAEYAISWQRTPHYPIVDWLKSQLIDPEVIRRTQKQRRELVRSRQALLNGQTKRSSRQQAQLPVSVLNSRISAQLINGIPKAWNSMIQHMPKLKEFHQALKQAKTADQLANEFSTAFTFPSSSSYNIAVSSAAAALMKLQPEPIKFSPNSDSLPMPSKPAPHLLASALVLLKPDKPRTANPASLRGFNKTSAKQQQASDSSRPSITAVIADSLEREGHSSAMDERPAKKPKVRTFESDFKTQRNQL
jgi:hypothetical protein